MPTRNITAVFVEKVKPNGKRTDYFDDSLPGFSLRVSEKGIKTWCISYRFSGKWTRYTFGIFPVIPLKEARQKAKDALHDVSNGINPATKKIATRSSNTFECLSDEYLERYAKKKKKSWEEDQRIIRTKLIPEIGNIRAKDVTRAQIKETLERIASIAPIQANRTLACIRKIYNWALSEDLVEANPCARIPAPGEEHQRDRVLSEAEIKILWKEFEKERHPVASTFKLRLITAQRGSEVHLVEWTELDLPNGWWTIPAEKSKNGLAHRVPLSVPTVRIFEELRKHQDASKTRKHSLWVFPGRRGTGHLGTVQKAIERIRERTGIKDFTAHDLRRTAASMMTGMGIPRLTVSKILNHVEPGITAVYDRHSYDKEKQEALEAWSKRLMVMVSDLKEAKTEAMNYPAASSGVSLRVVDSRQRGKPRGI